MNKNKKQERRPLTYFGHKDDGRCTLFIKQMKLPIFWFRTERGIKFKKPENEAKHKVVCKLKMREQQNLERFLVAPERKNVWTGGIRSQCEGVLTAKNYTKPEDDVGVYTVIPEIEGSRVTVDAVYKMWLALESAMIRREFLLIVEDPALAHVTKIRTERWRLYNRYLCWGCAVSIISATFFSNYPSLYLFPVSLAMYGFAILNAMKQKDPASRYSEICVNKQYELDPDSWETCDAQVSLRYLRCPQYRLFKLEDHVGRDRENKKLMKFTIGYCAIAMFRKISSYDYAQHVIRKGFEEAINPNPVPLNIFTQLKNRFLTFGNNPGPGCSDLVHWIVQNGLLYLFILRHIPWMIQTALEYLEREYRMETSIRYLQFRNLQGEERYEFPARNLYRTMQKDFPKNRILKEMYDHYHDPPEGYYQSSEFLQTRKPEEVTLRQALQRWRISYYRNW